MPAHDETIKDIEKKIAETRKLHETARYWSSRLGTLENNILVLERAKTLLQRDEMPAEPAATVAVWLDDPTAQSQAGPPSQTDGGSAQAQQSSINAMIVKILSDVGQPMGLQEIWESIKITRPEVSLKTVGSVISQCLAKGLVRRTARARYATSLNQNGGQLVGQQE